MVGLALESDLPTCCHECIVPLLRIELDIEFEFEQTDGTKRLSFDFSAISGPVRPVHSTFVVDAVLQTKHVANFVSTGAKRPLKPGLGLFFRCFRGLLPIETDSVSTEGEDTAGSCGLSQPEDVVPRIPRVQVGIGDCEDAVSIGNFVLLESLQYLGCIDLELAHVVTRADRVCPDEVFRDRLRRLPVRYR